MALGTNLKFNNSVAKGLKVKVRKFLGLVPTFVKVTREKLVGGGFLPPPPPSRIGLILGLGHEMRALTIKLTMFTMFALKENGCSSRNP